MKNKKLKYVVGCILSFVACIILSFSCKLSSKANDEKATISGVTIDSLTDTQRESLYKLCKVWGLAKYYHPTVVAGELDWDKELFKMIPKVCQSENQKETNKILYDWLKEYTFKVNPTTKEYIEYKMVQKMDHVNNLDLSWVKDKSYYGKDLAKYLKKLSSTVIVDRENSYAFLGQEDNVINFSNEKDYDFDANDDGIKLLSLFRFWNIYNYYSPNIDITKEEWDKVLRDAIEPIVNANNYKEYVLAIATVTAKTGDAHIGVKDDDITIYTYYGKNILQCEFLVIDGQVVVKTVSNESKEQGLLPGDVITEVDGVTINERIQTLSKYMAIPDESKIVNQMCAALLRTREDIAEVKVKRNNEIITLKLNTSTSYFQKENSYKSGYLQDKQIGYIDPATLEEGDFEELMKDFSSTKGIIVDLRKYPTVFLPFLMGEYIIPEQRVFAKLSFPFGAIPGSFYKIDVVNGKGVLKDSGDTCEFPQYDGKVILLMDETSQSQSEYTIMALRQSPNATVVGSPSIGADGNVVNVSLPGNISLCISSLGVYTPDDGQTQRIGLKPDVECYPTIKGISEGRDELIEKGIEIIMNK